MNLKTRTMIQLKQRHTMPEITRKDYLNSLNKFIGLIEECVDMGLGIKFDNYQDYRDAVKEFNRYSETPYNASTTLRKIDELEENY